MQRLLYLAPYASLAAVLGFALYGFAISIQTDPEEILHPFARFCPGATSEFEPQCTLALYEDLSGLKPLAQSGEDSIRIWHVGMSVLRSSYWDAQTITRSQIASRYSERREGQWSQDDQITKTARAAELIGLLPALKSFSEDKTISCDPGFDGSRTIVEGVYQGIHFYSEPSDSEGCTDPRFEPIHQLKALLSEIRN